MHTRDLRLRSDLLTIGQYLCPSAQHLPVVRYYHPDEFAEFTRQGKVLGFVHVEAGPLVRSSYHAATQEEAARPNRHSQGGHHLTRYPYDNDSHA